MLKIKELIGILFLILIELCNCKIHKCHFGTLYQNYQPSKSPHDKPDELIYDDHFMSKMKQGRLLQTLEKSPIRITLDTTNLNTIYTPTNGEDKTTIEKLNFIKKAMLITEYFFEQRLKVSTIARVFAPNTCILGFTPPENDIKNGISSSDLHIYVRHITDNTIDYKATAKHCKKIQSKTLPDLTFQQGRPTVGQIQFNTYQIIDSYQVLTNHLFASITGTSIHEIIHVLGFDSDLYSSYLDPSTGNTYTTDPWVQSLLNTNRNGVNGNHYHIRTPKVLQWARKHFDCPTMVGMPLQNQEGSTKIPSHWQRASIYDELMTGTDLKTQKAFSGLTFSLLMDMGWYDVDDTFNDTLNFGYKKTCDFVENACYSSNTYEKYFCDAAQYSSVSQCSSNFLGKGLCQAQSQFMADGCGIFVEYMPCVDPDQSGDSYRPYTLQKYRTDSFCVESTLSNVGITDKYRGRCYPYVCRETSIKFTIGTIEIVCNYDFKASPVINEEGVQKTSEALKGGYLECPNYIDFCQQSRKVCHNWCSGNGFCTRGICNCYTGFFGKDCSRSQCANTQYWDESTASCVDQCPSRTYQNQYSNSCEYCEGCDECRDQPQICTGCLSSPSNPLYYHKSKSECVSQCPSDTFRAGDDCQDCDTASPENCKTCSMTSSNCTSCSTPTGASSPFFLQNPISGTCIQTCLAPYTIYDIHNFKCVKACIDNVIYYGTQCSDCPTGPGYCDLCPEGQYKYIENTQCLENCPEKYYQNSQKRLCESCHSSCLQCSGQFAENCTKCQQASSLKYLYLKMCVSSCPRGSYANQDEGSCITCPIQDNCATCKLNADSQIQCESCNYGYYLQSDNTCKETCISFFYKNKWNHTCDACHPDCGDCTTSTDSSCINCRSPKYFLANVSGGFCLSQCPTELYVKSGQKCLDCFDTCLTCSGVNSDECESCIEGYYLYKGLCRYVCPAGTYQNKENRKCQSCDGSCTFCFGPTIDNCTACTTNLVLDNFTCASECSHNLTVNQWGVCFENRIYMMIGLVVGMNALMI